MRMKKDLLDVCYHGNFAEIYGYPECCHYYFHSDALVFIQNVDGKGLSDKELALGFFGTGYRPCPVCQEKLPQDVYDGICRRRAHDAPFPLENSYIFRVNPVMKFIRAMDQRNVTLQTSLIRAVLHKNELSQIDRNYLTELLKKSLT